MQILQQVFSSCVHVDLFPFQTMCVLSIVSNALFQYFHSQHRARNLAPALAYSGLSGRRAPGKLEKWYHWRFRRWQSCQESILLFEARILLPVATIRLSGKSLYRKTKILTPLPKRMQPEQEGQPLARRNEQEGARQQIAMSISMAIQIEKGKGKMNL